MSNLSDNVQNNSNVQVCNENENQNNEENGHVEGSGYSFSRQDADILLVMLRTDKNANRKGIWDNRDSCFLLSICTTVDAMKSLRDVGLKVFVRYMHNKTDVKLRESDAKHIKLIKLGEAFGFTVSETLITPKPRQRAKPIQKLSVKAASVMQSKKVPKQVLNASYSEYIWPEKLEDWNRRSPLQNEVKINDTELPDYWFYIPEFSTRRQQLEVKCVGGIEGISNHAWLKVAKSKKTLLSPIMVEDIVDPMSVSMANTHFSKAVEDSMRVNGDFEAASLCKDIREWWFAEDTPGIHAKTRIDMRMNLRRRLVNCVDHSKFPPPTMYVRGWPTQLWEALLASIDAKSILYALCKQGTYNTRAFSSMMGETFFSELTNEDPRGHRTVSVEDFAYFLGTSIEQMRARLDSDRTFVYRTSKSAVYTLVEQAVKYDSITPETEICSDTCAMKQCITSIVPRNHFFDTEERRRTKGKAKEGCVSTGRNAVLKGTLGVRWEKVRINESKMLVDRRMGISSH